MPDIVASNCRRSVLGCVKACKDLLLRLQHHKKKPHTHEPFVFSVEEFLQALNMPDLREVLAIALSTAPSTAR